MRKLTLMGVLGMLLPILSLQAQTIRGRVTTTSGETLPDATLFLKKGNTLQHTDQDGVFAIVVHHADTLIVSHIGYLTRRLTVTSTTPYLDIQLTAVDRALNEVVVQAYGTTTRRLNTGNIAFVTDKDIDKQVALNPLGLLQGRIAGLVVTQSNGLPGSTYSVQLRGQNSLHSGTQPLYIVDGVPFIQNASLSKISATSASSPFNSINPGDIERIDVLKDADATAIYGSQGANGVIIITTKKAKPGSLTFSLDAYTGGGKVTRTAPLLESPSYLAVRKEAFGNDGIVPTQSNAPDLLLWDSTDYTDWKSLFIGGSSSLSNVQASLSGGDTHTSFLLGTSFNSQKTMFPQSKPAKRANGYLNVSTQSNDGRFKARVSTAYSVYTQDMPRWDFTNYIYLPPNAPAVYDSTGDISWDNWNGVDNPMARLYNQYTSRTDNFIANGSLQYEFLQGLILKINLGYDHMQLNEENRNPIKAQRPGNSVTGSMAIQTGTVRNWTTEPTLVYSHHWGKHTLRMLGGLSFQDRKQTSLVTEGLDYTDDALLGNIGSAGQLVSSNTFSQYRYSAVYGNGTYNYDDRYLLNLNIRRDGSSRFGPSRRFATFGSVGGSWIFTKEKFMRQASWLSFGKLRFSYGITGNDQISDYVYLDSWSTPFTSPYNGQTGILPDKLANPYIHWERTKKLEIALDLGFWNDNVLVSSAYYKNRSDNQLVGYSLPGQTGYSSIIANLDALLQNSGWEFTLEINPVKNRQWQWHVNTNVSFPSSKLVKYPGLQESSDRYSYRIGTPLTTKFGYRYLGVDATTGIYSFKDIDGDGGISVSNDYTDIGNMAQRYYGGLGNSIVYKNWSLDLFFQFVKQTGYNYLYYWNTVPGGLGNQTTYALDRWRHEGDISPTQRFSSGNDNTLNLAFQNYRNSSAAISDASFVRLKNVSLSYMVPSAVLKRIRVQQCTLYLQGQNLWTTTAYKGADPESQNPLSLPPVRWITAGIRMGL